MDEQSDESEEEEVVGEGRASITRTLNRDEVMKVWKLGRCENFVGKREELVFSFTVVNLHNSGATTPVIYGIYNRLSV